MAEELRWETLAPAGTTTDANSSSEFRNDSSRDIHIRELNWACELRTGANDESGVFELSKSPVIASATNNGVFFIKPIALGVSGGTTGSGADDVFFFANGQSKYAKGQLTLEPGESLFTNENIISGTPNMVNRWVLGYHF